MKFFDINGIYGDDEMPAVKSFRSLALGQWVSPLIDVSPALDILPVINSGYIGVFMRPLDNNDTAISVSYDNGNSWEEVVDNILPDAERLNSNPALQLKCVIRSYISQLDKEKSPKLYSVSLILTDKKLNKWDTIIPVQLKWGDG